MNSIFQHRRFLNATIYNVVIFLFICLSVPLTAIGAEETEKQASSTTGSQPVAGAPPASQDARKAASLPDTAVPANGVNASTPAYGDRIILGTIGEASNLISYLSTDAPSHEVADLLFVAPLRYNKDLQIEPYAAEKFEILEDGKLLRFTLRQGILWEDGVELTSDDMEYTFKMVTSPDTASPYAEDFMAVREFRKTGRYTFEARYDKFFARAISSWMNPILPKHVLEGQNIRNTPFSRKPIGAGPYRLKSWESGLKITLEASPTYFDGQPYISEVVYRIIPDISTMFMEARALRLDLMNLSPQQYLRQTTGPFWEREWRKYRYLASMYVFLGFNMRHPFFQDKRVRWAISRAIDREGIVKGVLLGQGVPAFGPYKPGSWAYDTKLSPVRQDVAEAARLLDEAGFKFTDGSGIRKKDGVPLSFTILTNQGNEQRILTATVIQSQLKAVGVDVHIRTVEWAAFIKEFVDKGRFDTVILGWTVGQDPDIYDVWHSSKARPGGLNFTYYKNPELDAILEAARSEPDQSKRKILYDRLQEIMADDQPYCFLFVPYALPMVQARFHGIAPALAGIMYNFDKWWVPKQQQKYSLK